MKIRMRIPCPSRRRGTRKGRPGLESLESRRLLSSAGLLSAPGHHRPIATARVEVRAANSPSALFGRGITSLQSQIQSGPLQALEGSLMQAIAQFRTVTSAGSSGKPELSFSDQVSPPAAQVSANQPAVGALQNAASSASGQFVSAVSSTVTRFIADVRSHVKPVAPQIARVLVLQGKALLADEVQWADKLTAGVYAAQNTIYPTTVNKVAVWGLNPSDWPYYYLKDATTTVTQLTQSRPLWPRDTPDLMLYRRADIDRHNLQFDVLNSFSLIASGQNTYNDSAIAGRPYVVSPGESAKTFVAGIQDLAIAETQSLRADFDATLQEQPNRKAVVDRTIRRVERDLRGIDLASGDPATQAAQALSVFNSQIMVGRGLFGPQGPLHRVFRAPTNPFPDTANDYARLYTFTNARLTKVTLTSADMTISRNGTRYAVLTRINSDPQSAPPLPAYNPANPGAYLAALKVFKEDNYYGAYLSTDTFTSSSQAIAGDALDQSWFHPNPATRQVYVIAPVGTVVYRSTAAPILQGLLKPERRPSLYPGGAQQTVVINKNLEYLQTPTVVTNLRTGAQMTLAIRNLSG